MTKKETKLSDEEVCNIAFDIALEEAFAVCNTPEGKQRAFNECAALLGIDDASTLSVHCQTILEDFADEKSERKSVMTSGTYVQLSCAPRGERWKLDTSHSERR